MEEVGFSQTATQTPFLAAQVQFNMDSGSNPFPSSQHPNHANLSSQIPNQFTPISHQFQPSYQLNPLNGSYPPYNNLPYGSHFSFQNLLNTPIISSEPNETHNSRGGWKRNPKSVHDSLALLIETRHPSIVIALRG